MISGLIGSLTLEAYRNGVKMQDPPALVKRPGVFSTPRDFFRDVAWNCAAYGEFIWWVVDRDEFNMPRRLLNLPLGQVQVTQDDKLPLFADYRYRDIEIPREDIYHGTVFREPGSIRGVGPLQLCGAALSAAVEADQWAARFFKRGGAPSVNLDSPVKLTASESENAVEQWLRREGNEVRVTSGGITAKPFNIDPESAQLLQSRQYSAAAVATMFGMDADLLNAAISGQSLTYQNVGQRFDNFIRSTLSPNYLEPIEHGISELLTRTTVARFSLGTLLRADVKTQADVYSVLVSAGMAEAEARQLAGIDTYVDTLPIPAPGPVPAVVARELVRG
jgi:HK97 family phage portal protein